jgi:pimeloyl-ACP methyl ester carboxylesterase
MTARFVARDDAACKNENLAGRGAGANEVSKMVLAATSHGSLHYDVVDQVAPWRGTCPAILFHHGIGASAGIWAGWTPALVDAYRLVRFDMRGCGRSVIPAPDFRWSLDLLVDDLFAIADAAGLHRFHLVGESIGGTIALAAAISRPERIATLCVSNGAHLGASIQRVEAWQRRLDQGGAKAWSDAFMPDRFHDDSLTAEERAWFATQQEAWAPSSILNALKVLIGTDLSPRLSEVRCPTLLLHPDGSPFIPVPIMADLHRLLPNAELTVIGHSRHGLPFSHAARCSALLRTFLDSHEVG